jgi:hypothetical protein
MTTTFNPTQIAPLMQKLEEAKAKYKAEERIALKKKLKCTMQSRKSGWQDTSGNEDLITAARRGLIREHIAKVAIMKQLGMDDIPTFAEVWRNYLERNSSNHSHENHCTTSSCGCGSNH